MQMDFLKQDAEEYLESCANCTLSIFMRPIHRRKDVTKPDRENRNGFHQASVDSRVRRLRADQKPQYAKARGQKKNAALLEKNSNICPSPAASANQRSGRIFSGI